MALRVQDSSSEVQEMATAWAIAEALLGGTAAMRTQRDAYLPKWPSEEPESYRANAGNSVAVARRAR